MVALSKAAETVVMVAEATVLPQLAWAEVAAPAAIRAAVAMAADMTTLELIPIPAEVYSTMVLPAWVGPAVVVLEILVAPLAEVAVPALAGVGATDPAACGVAVSVPVAAAVVVRVAMRVPMAKDRLQ